MCAWRRSALWPQLVAISLIGVGAAGCSNSGRFSDTLGPDPGTHSGVTGSNSGASGAGPRRQPSVAACGWHRSEWRLRRRPRHGLVSAQRRDRLGRAAAAAPAMDVGRRYADHRRPRGDAGDGRPSAPRADVGHHAGEQHFEPRSRASGPASCDPAPALSAGRSTHRRRRGSPPCLAPLRLGHRAPRWRRIRVFTLWRPARP